MEEPEFGKTAISNRTQVLLKYGALSGMVSIAWLLGQYIFRLYPGILVLYLIHFVLVGVWAAGVMEYRQRLGNHISFRQGWIMGFAVASAGHLIALVWLFLQAFLLLPDMQTVFMEEMVSVLGNGIFGYNLQPWEIGPSVFWYFQVSVFLISWLFYIGPTMVIAAFLKRE